MSAGSPRRELPGERKAGGRRSSVSRWMQVFGAVGFGLVATVLLSFASRQLSKNAQDLILKEPSDPTRIYIRDLSEETTQRPPERSRETADPKARSPLDQKIADIPQPALDPPPAAPLVTDDRAFKAPPPALGPVEWTPPQPSTRKPSLPVNENPSEPQKSATSRVTGQGRELAPGKSKRPAAVAESDQEAARSAQRIFGVGDVDRKAEPYASNRSPQYPRSLLRRRRPPTGEVVLEFVIGVDGKLKDLVVKSRKGPAIFEKVALAALRSWRFEPARLGGRRVAMRATKTIRFEGVRR